jgi:hypothetical protein
MTPSDESHLQGQSRGRLVLGIGLICFGLLFLAHRLHLLPQHFPFELFPVDEPWRLWPMLLVVLGLSKIAAHGLLHGKGHFLLGLGLVFQLEMMFRALNRPSKPEAPASVEPDSHE